MLDSRLDPAARAFLEQLAAANPPSVMRTPLARLRKVNELSLPPDTTAPELGSIADVVIPCEYGPLSARRYQPLGAGPFPIVLYFHGGGWVLNSVNTHDSVARRLTADSDCVVYSIDYRLAPEHPYPAAVHDALAAFDWVQRPIDHGPTLRDRIAVCGDSAGANLAVVLAMMARDRGDSSIRFQALWYPAVDVDFDRPSFHEFAEGYLLSREEMIWYWRQYAGSFDGATTPRLCPLRAPSLGGLPPALVITAECDPLRDEGEAFALALRNAGVAVEAERYRGMIHGFVRRHEQFPAGRAAIAHAGRAIRAALSTDD